MKAQGLPITVIIVAALGLLVLIVISAIFSGQIGKFGKASNMCPGECRADKCLENEKGLFGKYLNPQKPVNEKPGEYEACGNCCVPTG